MLSATKESVKSIVLKYVHATTVVQAVRTRVFKLIGIVAIKRLSIQFANRGVILNVNKKLIKKLKKTFLARLQLKVINGYYFEIEIK